MPVKLRMELDRLSITDFPSTGSIVDLPVRPGGAFHAQQHLSRVCLSTMLTEHARHGGAFCLCQLREDDLGHTCAAQDDVLARILQFLDPAALSTAEWVCKRFRSLGKICLQQSFLNCSPYFAAALSGALRCFVKSLTVPYKCQLDFFPPTAQ